MFTNGAVSKEVFIEHIQNNGAVWLDTICKDDIAVHFFLSIDGSKRVQIAIVGEDIPKFTALAWLRQLGLR